MLGGLLDADDHGAPGLVDADDHGAPAPVELDAGVARGHGRGRAIGRRGRGRGVGYKWSDATRAKIAATKSKRAKEHIEKAVLSLGRAVAPSVQTYVSEQILGASSSQPRGHEQRQLLLGNSTVTTARRGRGQHDYNAGLGRAVVSVNAAQCNGLCKFASDERNVFFWSTNVFDDASMWVLKSQVQNQLTDVERVDPRVLQKLERKGKNVNLPVLNVNEDWFALKSDPVAADKFDCASAAEVFTPAQVLPLGNAGTVYNRWQRVTAHTMDGSGSFIDRRGDLTEVLSNMSWRTLVMVKDNLNLNNCLVALEQQKIDQENRFGVVDCSSELSLLDINCCGHSAVLCTKPLILSMDLHVHLIRLGNIMKSGRSWDDFLHRTKALAEHDFECKRCARLPDFVVACREEHKLILRRSRPAHDLTEAEEEFILNASNHSWKSKKNIHWCAANCPLGCNGDESAARAHYVSASVLCAGGPICEPLLYRWKGFEEGVAYGYRAQRYKGFLGRVLSHMYSPQAVADAERQLASFAAMGVDDVDDMAQAKCRKTVRGGKLATWISLGEDAKQFDTALTLSTPVQHYLNHSFAAEAATSEVVKSLKLAASADNSETSTDFKKQLKAAVAANLDIITGERGRQVVREFSQLLTDFGHEAWARTDYDDKEKFDSCEVQLLCIGEAWWRLVFKMESQPKLQIMKVCAADEYDDLSVQSVAQPFLDKAVACKDCVGPYFTLVWARRLCDRRPGAGVRRRAFSSMKYVSGTLRANSTSTERKHLLGQETGGVKRGRKLGCKKLQMVTLAKSIQKSAFEAQAEVEKKHLPTKKMRADWQRALSVFEINRPRFGGRKQVAGGAKLTAWGSGLRQKRKRVRALDVFNSSEYQSTPTNESLPTRRKLLTTTWKTTPDAEKDRFKAKARAEQDVLDETHGQNFREFCNSGSASVLRRTVCQSAKRLAAEKTPEEINADPTWSSGTGLLAYGTGLKPELVTNVSAEEVTGVCDELFGFDGDAIANDWSSMQCFSCCELKHGGLCGKDDATQLVETATYNMYIELGKAKLKDNGPLLIDIAVPDCVVSKSFYLYLRTFGKGEVCLLMPMVRLNDTEPATYAPKVCDGACMPTTSHLAFRLAMVKASRDMGCDFSDMPSVGLSIYNTRRDASYNKYAVQVIWVSHYMSLKLSEKAVRPKNQQAKDSELPFGLSLNDATKAQRDELKSMGAKSKSGDGDGHVSDDSIQQSEQDDCEWTGTEDEAC